MRVKGSKLKSKSIRSSSKGRYKSESSDENINSKSNNFNYNKNEKSINYYINVFTIDSIIYDIRKVLLYLKKKKVYYVLKSMIIKLK